jgi:hypothetical protein
MILYALILLLGIASYTVGAVEIVQGKYKPSMFSRIVWLLLAINAFAGVIGSGGTTASILLAGILLLGSLVICLLSFWRGNKTFGKLEWVCLGLLALSLYVWVFYDAPYVSLLISLLGDLIGGLPTFRNVWKNPQSESLWFWGFFFLSCGFGIVASIGSPWTDAIVPIYFTLFDGVIFALCLRRRKSNG